MAGVVRLNHAVLFVSDVDRAVAFYRDVLGFSVAARADGLNGAFLRAAGSDNHHDLGLFGLGAGAGPASGRHTGLYHLAWQVPTIEELATIREALLASGAYTGESDHGATKSVYGRDPDQNQFEVMWMVPRESWGRFADEGVVEPLDLAAELERWAGVTTA